MEDHDADGRSAAKRQLSSARRAVARHAQRAPATPFEQSYRQAISDSDEIVFDYEAPRFDFSARLAYDRSGLVVRYPGIATRVGVSTID